ncbi:MAG: polyprenyl synthetase family protein [Thermanaerothrix sp.]|jgi:geranylgeranyl diphosphate synthase type I|uniref:Polyprenyl synthetase family protein n=3 Tax=Thermanaerothrix TaxID=1077886 RepID=A0ABU3NIX6_9CHLR|nr:polyprenyl synthetase family protein [Thermanaerothrix sp. 4228-RoL]MDT8896797.1 polyprenyl synthetase family protein [Thermanaerothrix sp. 4228-RoL]
MMSTFTPFFSRYRPQLEALLQEILDYPILKDYPGMAAILRYHMGWEGEGAGQAAQGKRLRPMLLLLVTEAVGGDWGKALPAAAAVELLHNFSLIHDDIEDRSPMRRGRPTVWARWGEAQAINAGDAMFAAAFMALSRLQQTLSPNAYFRSQALFIETCLRLTGGQHLDIAFEQDREISFEHYWTMIAGKTAALIQTCAHLGALIGGAEESVQHAFASYGNALGLCFQVVDDWLGIWGSAALTGKSTESDLVSGKKTLPVVLGLARNGRFAQRWREGQIQPHEASVLAQWLIEEGVQHQTELEADRLTREALEWLERTELENEVMVALRELTHSLLSRQQ